VGNSVQVLLRLQPEVMAALAARAKADLRSVPSMAAVILTRDLLGPSELSPEDVHVR
jgi:hypothetical protein